MSTIQVPTLVSGVTQLDPSVASSSHSSEEINRVGDPVEGNKCRYPGEHLADTTARSYTFNVTTSDGEDHEFIFTGSGVSVLDPNTGSPRSVSGATSYLTVVDPQKNLRATTLGDSVVVTNGTTVPTYTRPAGTFNKKRVVYLAQAVDQINYQLTIDGVNNGVTATTYDDAITTLAGITAQNNGYLEVSITDQGANGDTWELKDGSTTIASYTKKNQDEEEDIAYRLILALNKSNYGGPNDRVYGHIDYVNPANEEPIVWFCRSGGTASGLSVVHTGSGTFTQSTRTGNNPTKLITQVGAYAVLDEDWDITVSDGYGDALILTTDAVRSEGDKPDKAPDGKLLRVENTEGDSQDDLWYIFQQDDATAAIGVGRWVATTDNAGEFTPTASTWPHYFTYNSTTKAWTFSTIPWANGLVQQDEPQFLASGEPIRSVSSYRGRLGLHNSRQFFCRSGNDLFNPWRKSTKNIFPDDPIDELAIANIGVVTDTVQLGTDLLLRGSSGWGRILGSEAFTPDGIAMGGVSADLPLEGLPAEASGTTVMYLARGVGGTSLVALQRDLSPVVMTQHVPSYLPRSPTWFAASRTDLQCALGDGSSTVWLMRWNGQLPTWRKFTMWGKVTGGAFVGSNVHLIVGSTLVSVSLLNNIVDPQYGGEGQQGWLTRLDNRMLLTKDGGGARYTLSSQDASWTSTSVPVSRSIDTAAETTTYTFTGFTPAGPSDSVGVCILSADTSVGNQSFAFAGYQPRIISWDGTQLVLDGMYAGSNIWFGRKYIRELHPLPPYYKDQGGGAMLRGRTQILKCDIEHRGTSSYQVEVTNTRTGVTKDFIFVTQQVAEPLATLAEVVPQDGHKRVSVHMSNRDLSMRLLTDSPLPATWQSLSWLAKYTDRHRR